MTSSKLDPTSTGTPAPQDKHPFKVTVRTLAGHSRKETVKPTDTVREVTADAVKYFVHRGQLPEGGYALTLPRTGHQAELDPTATVRDAGIVEDDVLVLINRAPQVDG
ncbi:hypothetical protein GCM10023328_11600 [Modestobacter marinus]|uniref:Ubiquitin-like domain-containing protein n=1 Tax=Modestobacter marinus TaxID=477641 RepID=A0A846LU79_9ACTN|nr:hypothetical protein [Modestobacter marinus]NIH69205.1 hypothetical protein [Modestobacter marinus]GGL76678.1 hypothetical protein GCM10011589_35950 [Modestobacter marinus]